MASPVSETERRLLEQIAHSDDLQAVRVYADWLLEQDATRAEFVEIQLRRAKHLEQDGDTIRSRVLIEKHWRDWLGPAAEVVAPTSLRFEHGVLRECRLIDPGDDDARLNAASHVQLSTLRTLHGGTMPVEHLIGVVGSVAKLRTLETSVAGLRELARRKTQVDTLLECVRQVGNSELAVDWIATLEAWDGAPNLKAVDLGPLFTEEEILATTTALRETQRLRAIPTLRAEIRSRPPLIDDAGTAERVGRWVTGASTIAAECVDARTLRARAWLLFQKGHASSRLEVEAYNPEDAAGLLNWIDHPSIGHVLVRSSDATNDRPGPHSLAQFDRAHELWTTRGIEIVVPDAWVPRGGGR